MDNTLILPQSLCISSVSNLLENVRKIISTEDRLVLDVKDVKEIDALGLQLILAIQKTGLLNNVKIDLINVGPKLQRILFLSSLSK
jgi:anti-anti-sigma regulatory factor